jgi:hypothetical protein
MVTSAQAQYAPGDLIVGFTSGSGNDLVYDIGTFSSLVNGETFSLNSAITTTAGHANLNNLNWGVVGAQNVLGVRTAYSTVPHGQTTAPANINGSTAFNTVATAVNTIGQFITSGPAGTDAASDAASWNGETIVGGGGTYFNVYGSATPNNPNSTTPASFTSGSIVEDVYGVQANNSAGNLLGTFTFDSTGTLTFNTVAVPEPSTYGLLAGLGLLALTVRRQFGWFRKS